MWLNMCHEREGNRGSREETHLDLLLLLELALLLLELEAAEAKRLEGAACWCDPMADGK